jgi:hypothetical protein
MPHGERGAGKGGRPCPASAHRSPERDERSVRNPYYLFRYFQEVIPRSV